MLEGRPGPRAAEAQAPLAPPTATQGGRPCPTPRLPPAWLTGHFSGRQSKLKMPWRHDPSKKSASLHPSVGYSPLSARKAQRRLWLPTTHTPARKLTPKFSPRAKNMRGRGRRGPKCRAPSPRVHTGQSRNRHEQLESHTFP